jgi:hypothetical protein
MKTETYLINKYPPSPACACDICLTYCARPGWWTVSEATQVLNAGYAKSMMLEISPDRTFGVLSPAFKNNGGFFALAEFAKQGCVFFINDQCGLHGTDLQPLECRFCHHDRPGQGPLCHAEIAQNWDSPAGRALVLRWGRHLGLIPLFKQFHLHRLIMRR